MIVESKYKIYNFKNAGNKQLREVKLSLKIFCAVSHVKLFQYSNILALCGSKGCDSPYGFVRETYVEKMSQQGRNFSDFLWIKYMIKQRY